MSSRLAAPLALLALSAPPSPPAHLPIGIYPCHPPLNMRDPASGELKGFDIELRQRLAAGYGADFTFVYMKHPQTIDEDWIASPGGWTPFAAMTVQGWPAATIIRGTTGMRQHEVLGPPMRRLTRFHA